MANTTQAKTYEEALCFEKNRTARAHSSEALSHYPDYRLLKELKRCERAASQALDDYLDQLSDGNFTG